MPSTPRKSPRLGLITLLFLAAGPWLRAQVTWTGAGTNHDYFAGASWTGGAVPANNGTATVSFGKVVGETVLISAPVDIAGLNFTSQGNKSATVRFTATSARTFTIRNGITTPSADTKYSVTFDSNLTLVLPTNQTWSLSNSTAGQAPTIDVGGVISGAGQLTLVGNTSVQPRAQVILRGNNTYTGGTVVNGLITQAYTSTAYGTGTLTFLNGGSLLAHNTLNITNALSLSGTLNLRSQDAVLTLSGPVTLTGNTFLLSQTATFAPYATWFTGNISGGFSLTKNDTGLGNGIVFLGGTNTYTGGTTINGGALVFTSAGAIPSTGTVNVTTGYAGLAFTSGNLATDFANFNKATSGTIGFDTAPGSGTIVISGPVNLGTVGTGAIGFTNTSLKIGTATSAIISGTITPVGTNYLFAGAAGGVLTVQSGLSGARQVQLSVPNALNGPMTLLLKGSNSYSAGTLVTGGNLIFSGSGSVPSSGQLTASGTSAYIGQTEGTGTSDATFVGRFNAASTTGIVGFDSANVSSPRTVDLTSIDFASFGSTASLGTATKVTLTGTLTHPSGAGGYTFSSTDGGSLTVASVLGGSNTVTLRSNSNLKEGTITLTGTNTYSGGTTLSGLLKVVAGNANAFGTGAIATPSSFFIDLQTLGNFSIPNAIVLNTGASNSTLQVGGANDFTLSGVISGGATNGGLTKVDANTVTLSAVNTFTGPTEVTGGLLRFIQDTSSAMGVLRLTGGNAEFTSLAPTVHGLEGNSGTTLTLAAGSTLTLDTPDDGHDFDGTLIGNGSSLSITGHGSVEFSGANTGLISTTILGGVAFASNNQAFGSGSISIAASSPTVRTVLGLNSGITLTNALTVTSGIVIGYGTLTPGNGALQIGSNATVSPGAALGGGPPGTLSFGNGLTFAGGGTYDWSVVNAAASGGLYSTINVTGALSITANSGSPFTLSLASYDSSYASGQTSNFNSGISSSWTLVTASSGITGFAPNVFAISTTNFLNGLAGGQFSVTSDATHLYLNFTPVPEPSVEDMLAGGLGLLGLIRLRRMRRSPSATKDD